MKKYIFIYFPTCTVITLTYLAGIIFFLTDQESEDKCEMTYMFEYPQYIHISQQVDLKFPKYGLYAYGEGRMTKYVRNMHFDGIPILFIPGNAGSHRQVRSLASVALRKALNSGTRYHFDYFSIDFNSEFSAMYGPILFKQEQYVLECINRVLELYKNRPNPPKQIVLIGHSVGGIIAKRAITSLVKQNKYIVSILISLASPLHGPPLFFDSYIKNFYETSLYKAKNITSVSIAGSYSDILVPAYLTVSKDNNINVVATNIPKVWVESNHVQILWCKQLVLVINRALFDSVNQTINQISTDSKYVQRVFNYYFIQNSGFKLQRFEYLSKLIKMDYKGEWIEDIRKRYMVDFKRGLQKTHWYMVGITTQPGYEILTVLVINLEVTDWVFVCNAAYLNKKSKVCIEGEHMSHQSELLATSNYKRRLITINMHELRKYNQEYTHIVFRALPSSKRVKFYVDIYSPLEREKIVDLPIFSINKQTIINETPEKMLILNLIFPALQDIIQSYYFYVEPTSCDSEQYHATASLLIPWANESIHAHFTETYNKPFVLRFQNIKPLDAESAKIRLILDFSCRYKISIRLHIWGVVSQIVRYYSQFLISTLALVFLVAFQSQIRIMGKENRVPMFLFCLIDGLQQTWILVLTFFFSFVLRGFIPEIEFNISSNLIYSVIVMILLTIISFGVFAILFILYCISLFTLESTVHKLTLKLLAKSVRLTFGFSDYFLTFVQKIPLLASATLVILCFVACGEMALCIGLVFYFLKLTQMSQKCIEQITWLIVKDLAKKFNQAFRKEQKVEVKSTEEGIPTENVQKSTEIYATSGEIKKSLEIKTRQRNSGLEQSSKSETNIKATWSKNKSEEINSSKCASLDGAIHFHSSIFFIWTFVTALNLPTLLIWAHNFGYNKNLTDASLLPGLVFSIGSFFLWEFDLPRLNRKFMSYYLLRLMVLCLIPICILYSSTSIYRINYMFSLLFILVLLQQVVPIIEDQNETNKSAIIDDMTKLNEEKKYEEMKTKLD